MHRGSRRPGAAAACHLPPHSILVVASSLQPPADADPVPSPTLADPPPAPVAHFAPPPAASPIVSFTAFIPNQTPETFDQGAYLGLVSAKASAAGAVGAIASVVGISTVGRRRLASLGIDVATRVTFPAGETAAAVAFSASVRSDDSWLQAVYGSSAGSTGVSSGCGMLGVGTGRHRGKRSQHVRHYTGTANPSSNDTLIRCVAEMRRRQRRAGRATPRHRRPGEPASGRQEVVESLP